jgi:acyl-CoA thioester hydrolase
MEQYDLDPEGGAMTAFVGFRSVVDPKDCDFLGHMNVSKYFAACSDAVFAIQSEMGFTADDMRKGRKLSFAVVHAESDFRSELSAGEAIFMETEVMEIGTKSMTFRHRLFASASRKLAFETVFKCVLMSLQARIAVQVPDDVREKASAWLAGS